MTSSKIVIGREEDCEFILQDPRMSRHHASLERKGDRIYIRDLDSKVGVFINGHAVKAGELKHGDKVLLGDTEILIDFSALASLPTEKASAPSPISGSQYGGAAAPGYMSPPQAKPKSPLFYLLVATVLGIGGLVLFGDSKKKAEDDGIRGQGALQAEIEKIQKRSEMLAREKEETGLNSRQYVEAQSAYIKGFRDYREGNYSRAIQNFTAALALFPKHQLAEKYRRLAERRLDELVQTSLFNGRKYMEQAQYDRALSEFRHVLVLINDKTNKRYQEAEERIKEIQLLLKGRY